MESIIQQAVTQLLEGAVEPVGSETWKELYFFYWDIVRRWVVCADGCPEWMPQEVFQETMVSVIQQMPRLEYNRQKGHFRAFMKSTVYAAALEACRRREKQAEIDKTAGNVDLVGPDFLAALRQMFEQGDPRVDVIWLESVLRQSMRRACGRVDHITYRSFCLHVIESLDFLEVARRLDIINLASIYSAEKRSLHVMKEEFGKVVEKVDELGLLPCDVQVKGKMFEEAYAGLLKRKQEFTEPAVFSRPPDGLLERLEFMAQVLKRKAPPEEGGAYLCVVNWTGAEDATAEVSTNTSLISIDTWDRKRKKEAETKARESNFLWIKLPEELRIGRKEENDLVLPTSIVSSFHATVGLLDGLWLLKDHDSANGTFVNESPISFSVLKPGDIIQIASSHLLLFIIK